MLPGPGDPEGARRHVTGDDRTGGGVGAVADAHRRHQHRVDADERPGADRRAVLRGAVVVGGDRAGPDVRSRADVGVADVRQVRHLRPGADGGILDLDERARLGARLEHRSGPQIGERADAHALADLGALSVGVHDPRLRAHHGVDQRAERAHRRLPADAGGAVEARERRDDRVLADLDVDVDHRRGGIDDRHPGPLVALVDLALGDRGQLGQRHPIVDPGELELVGDLVRGHRPPRGAQDRHHVGQVVLALGVVGPDLGQRRDQPRAVEGVDPGVDLAHGELVRRRVAGRLRLDDTVDAPVRRSDHPPVAGRVVEGHGHDRRRRAGLGVRSGQIMDRLRPQQGHVAVEHDHRLGALEVLERRAHRVGGAARLVLDRHRDVVIERGREPPARPVDHDDRRRAGLARRRHRPADHRPPAERVQELRHRGAHPRALSGRHDHHHGIRHGPDPRGQTRSWSGRPLDAGGQDIAPPSPACSRS